MWDELMKEGLDIYIKLIEKKESSEDSYPAYLNSLRPILRRAVILGDFHTSITQNRGIIDWVDHGYCHQIDKLKVYVAEIGGSSSKNILSQLHYIRPLIDLSKPLHEVITCFSQPPTKTQLLQFKGFEVWYKRIQHRWTDQVERYLEEKRLNLVGSTFTGFH